MDEQMLITSAVQGDENSFSQLAELVLPKIKALLVSRYRLQPADIEDILQIALIRAWKSISYFRRESSFVTWFYTIVRNAATDFLNNKKRIETREIPAHHISDDSDNDYEHLSVEQVYEETAASIIEKRELLDVYRGIIASAFQTLSSSHSQIITMALEEEKTYKDIANELNIPIGTVMSRLFFARKKAQQLIIQYAGRTNIRNLNVGRHK